MPQEEIAAQLESIRNDKNFVFRSSQLVDLWKKAGVGPEAIIPVLRFMEQHPNVDFGAPGPLVHFIEQPFGTGGTGSPDYSEAVLASLERVPTAHTVWLLNRLINATFSPDERRRLTNAMERAVDHPKADTLTREEIREFLNYQASSDSTENS